MHDLMCDGVSVAIWFLSNCFAAVAGQAERVGQVAQPGPGEALSRDSLPGALAGRISVAGGYRTAVMRDAVSAAVSGCSHNTQKHVQFVPKAAKPTCVHQRPKKLQSNVQNSTKLPQALHRSCIP